MSIKEETLGEKHKNFNKLVLDFINQNPNQELEDIDYGQTDTDNLLKIEVACRTRNVQYLLKVLKCEDMLYVSRAINHSMWFVQDAQYAHIVNPQYLHCELFPYMLTEARNKLLLHIRLNLKDPARCEEFFNYLVDLDLNAAMKWFPNCSVSFIISRLDQDIYRIPESTILRLLWVTMEPLRIYIKNVYWKKPILEKAMFIINKHGDEYFDILDTIDSGQLPTFNTKYTKLIMKKCPQRLMLKFDRYGDFIDGTTFVNYIRKEDLQEFITNNASNKKLNYLLPEEKCQKILKLKNQNMLMRQLLESDPHNLLEIKEVLQTFHDSYLNDDIKKFKLHFINTVVKNFKTHRFDDDLWRVLSDIYRKIGVYTQYKRHFQACFKSIIVYNVVHNKTVPQGILPKLFKEFDTFKAEKNKLNADEKKKVFEFLYKIASERLEICAENDELLPCLESVFLLLQTWGHNWKDYPLVVNKVEELVKPMRDLSNIEAIKTLYERKRVWRKILFNESFLIKPHEDTFINALKHNPKLLHLNKEVVACLDSKDVVSMKRFFRKLRIYWADSLAKSYKNSFMKNLHTKPSKSLFLLLSKGELSDLLESYFYKDYKYKWDELTELVLLNYIAKNMYRARPKPSIDVVHSYCRGIFVQDALSSFKSVLHSMPAQQTIDYIKLQECPEFVQKLCVFQAFTKLKNKVDIEHIISNIWKNTKYNSVRADIFKLSYKSLKKFNKNDMNSNIAYNDRVKDEWRHLKHFIESLTDNESVIVYNLLSKFEAIPLVVRTEYCILGYKFLKSLPPKCNCRKFMNKIVSKIQYNHVLPSLDLDFVAEMVNDTIIKRLWTEKLDWTFMNVIFACVSSPNTEAKQMEAFQKVLVPFLDNSYKMWDVKTQGIFLVRYNFYKFISHIDSYKVLLENNKFTILEHLLDSLQRNLSIKENYILITSLKLAVQYFNVLSKCEKGSPRNLHEKCTSELSKICIKIFCEDLTSYSSSVWQLFFHAMQMMLSSFGIAKSTQYKIGNCMLDLSKDLSPDTDVLVHILILQHIYYVEYGNEDRKGRKALRDRIAVHPSRELKAHCSKLLTIDSCNIPYFSYLYNVLKKN